ncbi:hypothetical protein BT69DRAFT_1283259 [Atractiella rhizophila]|nr:hypothetical protein BT69DRAFT_1283259 [Atractiella rhizophila]
MGMLTCLHVPETIHTGDTITNSQYTSSFLNVGASTRSGDARLENGRDFRHS